MTAETRTPAPTLRAALRSWWQARHHAPARPLPLHEALAIGLGCNIANLERSTHPWGAGDRR
jgi:hypothetical protein